MGSFKWQLDAILGEIPQYKREASVWRVPFHASHAAYVLFRVLKVCGLSRISERRNEAQQCAPGNWAKGENAILTGRHC